MRKHTDTKEVLLETAIDLIRQSSYIGVGINEICAKAGVTKGGFYHYFDSKTALFRDAAQHYWEKTKSCLDELFSPAYTSLEQLEYFIQFIINKQKAEIEEKGQMCGCPIFTTGVQSGQDGDEIRNVVRELSDKVQRYCSALAKNLQADKHVNSTLDPVQIGRMLHCYIHGMLVHSRVHQDFVVVEKDLREAIYHLLDLKPELRRPPSTDKSDNPCLMEAI